MNVYIHHLCTVFGVYGHASANCPSTMVSTTVPACVDDGGTSTNQNTGVGCRLENNDVSVTKQGNSTDSNGAPSIGGESAKDAMVNKETVKAQSMDDHDTARVKRKDVVNARKREHNSNGNGGWANFFGPSSN